MTNVHVSERIHDRTHAEELTPLDHGATRSGEDVDVDVERDVEVAHHRA